MLKARLEAEKKKRSESKALAEKKAAELVANAPAEEAPAAEEVLKFLQQKLLQNNPNFGIPILFRLKV